jgi:type IVB pilus formation R64 PilN family outer membrane protein
MSKLHCIAVAAAVAASGCTHLTSSVERDIDSSRHQAERLKGPAAQEVRSAPVVVKEDGMYIARESMPIVTVQKLPAAFDQAATFDRTVASLTEFAQRLSLRAGMTVQASPDAISASQRTLQAEAGSGLRLPAPGSAGGAGGLRSPVSVPGSSAASLTASSGMAAQVRITYVGGTLRGLLDSAAARFGVYWRYADGAIQFYYTDTQSFQIRAIPGDASMSTTVANNSSDGGSGTGSSVVSDPAAGGGGGGARNNAQSTAVSSKLSVFDGIEKAVAAMLSPAGKVVASPATGTVSVTDTPEVLKRVARFVEDENKALSRQVMVNVTVLAVAVNDLDDYGIDWNLVYGNLSTKYGVTSSFSPQAGAAAFSAAVLNTSSSKLAGSTLMMTALSTQGKVRRETSASVATLNNQPVPVQVARQTSFLKSSSTSLTANVGSTTTLEPGTVTSGFNMTILPHVLSDGTVMLQFGTDISSLRTIRTVSSGSGANATSIQAPEVDTRNFLQRVAMKSGETLVVSGFEQTDANVDRKGVGRADFFPLGGGVSAGGGKEVIVILVTPVAMAGAGA